MVTVAIAIVGTFISFISLYRTWKLQRQQMRLQTKQEELTDLQLESLRKQAAGTQIPAQEKADIRVDLEHSGGDYKFVITNWGRVSARDITFELDLKEGRSSPLVQGDYNEKIPIPELAPGARCVLLAAPTHSTGTSFQARWSWRNPDGSLENRVSLLAI
jgi:hypothetical protein